MIELKNLERSYKTGHTETWVLRTDKPDDSRGRVCHGDGAVGSGKIFAAECAGDAR